MSLLRNKGKKYASLFIACTMVTGLITIPEKTVKAEMAEHVVISEVYGGGGNSGAEYKNDFIELYNPTDSDIDITGWKVEYASKTGAFSTTNFTELKGVIKAGGYYLIQEAAGSGGILDLPAADVAGSINMSGSECKVRLTDTEGNNVDFVGIGSSANEYETAPTEAMTNSTSVQRKDNLGNNSGETNGWDTNNNSQDFYTGAPTPRNSEYGEDESIEGLVSIKDAILSTEEVIVKGVVTFKEASGSSYNYAIQDGTAGVALRGAEGLNVGDEVIVKGTASTFNGLIQLNGYSLIENKGQKGLPVAKVVTVSDIIDNDGGEKYESQLVKLVDLTVESINLAGNTVLTDASGKSIILYKAVDLGKVAVGDKVEVTATLSQYASSGKDGYQLRINEASQVVVTESAIPEEKVDEEGPKVTKVTPGSSVNLGDNRRPEISATFEDESGVDMDTVTMIFNDVDVTAKLVKEENIVKYTVSEDLADGKHTVKVEVKDTLGNVTTKEWKFTVGTVETNLYFGQLHSHTNLSDGQGTIDEAYQYAQNTAGVDFMAVTDHSNWFDNDTSASLADGSMSKTWNTGLTAADKYNKEGEFVAIYGYEMTWSGSTGGYGHINTFNTPGFETRTNKSMDLKTYYNTLKTQEDSLSQLNHPGKTFGDFSDFAHYDAEVDEVVTLVEVGNGEGAIRSSGYFPSYEYYTRALDKGWHVAPTNNQDNHKGKWGNSNTARTVVEATDLSRDAIYEAISERRVYATEDENLRISYSVNGNTMGSILDATDSLEFKITVEDIDAGDNIGKISIIGDGGKVIKSIDNINSTTKEWTFTLDENVSSYYYVRVDQEDKDIAVTAPVWVGERENVGISTIDNDVELVVEGEEFNITTTVYNNEGSDLSDVRVEFYVDGAETPEVVEIAKVEASGTEEATLTHKFDKSGTYTIDVKVIANVNGNEREFTGSITVKVSKLSEVSKIVIDGAHNNQYVTGDYAGKINTLTGLMTQQGMKSVVNTTDITDELLEGASLLILSDPESGKNAASGKKYSEEELAVITRFVEAGGNIIITSKADYGDGLDEYGNAAQGNSVLEAIGATVRFNDDQATDYSNNGGQEYRLYFNNYNTESKWMEDVDTSKNYSFYSGSTLIMPKDTSNIDVLVRGHETTFGNDADKMGDNTPVGEGEVVGLAIETLENGSQVVVSGATFFSDFEIDGYVYSNYEITNKIISELAPAPQVGISSIADVRVDENNDNLPDRFGDKVSVEGYVTSASNASAMGNSFFDVIYVQDETAGITVFGVSTTEVKVGQKVRITGTVSSYLGDAQIAVGNEEVDLQIIDTNINLVSPTELSTADSMLEEKEGLLVKVTGKVTRIDGQNIYVNDGTGESRVYTEGYIRSSENPDVSDEWKSRVKVGDTVSAIGLASEDPEGHRLRVRDSAEIVVLEDESNSGNGSGGNPGVDVNPDGGNGSDSNNGDGSNGNTSNGGNTNSGTNLPNTGGTNSVIIIVIAIILVAGGVLFVVKGSKKKK